MRRLKPALLILAMFCGALAVRAETLPSGTEFVVELDRSVQPDPKSDQKFSGKLAFPVFFNQRQAVPIGTKIEGDVRGTKKMIFLHPRRLIFPDGQEVDFTATVSAINGQHLQAEEKEGSITAKGGGGSGGPEAQQAGEIGVTGALIGAMTTRSIGGAGIGAAVGVAAVLIGHEIANSRKNNSLIIPAGTQLTLSLSQSLDIPDAAAKSEDQAWQGSTDDRQDAPPVLRREDDSGAQDNSGS